MEGTGEVDGNHGVPALHGEVFHVGHMLDARVVHQNVHAPELCGTGLHHVLDVSRPAHVSAVVGHLHLRRSACGQNFGTGAVHIAKTIEHDVRALAGQGLSDSEANATGGAGDEGGFAFQHESLSE